MMLELETSRVREIIEMVSPRDAIDQEHLTQSCDYAIGFLPEIEREVEQMNFAYSSKSAKTNEAAHFVLKRLLAKRTHWLRENGGYRQMMAMG